jgi:hypothetical protein
MLVRPARLSDPIAPANGPNPASDPVAGFKNGNPVSRPPKLKGRYEAGDSRPKNRDGPPTPPPGRQVKIFGTGWRWNCKTERFHRAIGRTQPAYHSNLLKQRPPGQRHAILLDRDAGLISLRLRNYFAFLCALPHLRA